jgi:hypothetical protein
MKSITITRQELRNLVAELLNEKPTLELFNGEEKITLDFNSITKSFDVPE